MKVEASYPDGIGQVISLSVDAQGVMWIWSSTSGILEYQAGNFKAVPQLDLRVTALAQIRGQGTLLSSIGQGIVKISANNREDLGATRQLLVISLAQTTDGKVWLGSRGSGLFWMKDGHPLAVPGRLPDGKVNCLLATDNGGLWIGTDGGLAYWNGKSITEERFPAPLNHVAIRSLMMDRDGNLWLSTEQGPYRYTKGSAYRVSDGNVEETAFPSLFEDREGNVWLGDSRGVERLGASTFKLLSIAEGLPTKSVGPVFVDAAGAVWFAPREGGLYWLRDGQAHAVKQAGIGTDVIYSIDGSGEDLWLSRQHGGLTHLHTGAEVSARETYSLGQPNYKYAMYTVHVNRDQSVWAGTLTAGAFHITHGVLKEYQTGDGLASNSISSIEEGLDGTMWFGTREGLSVLANSKWHTYLARDNLPSSDIESLFQDQRGVLWIGTASGLAYYSNYNVHSTSQLNACLREGILGIAEDRSGWLWIATDQHLIKIKSESILQQNVQPDDVKVFGPGDGLSGPMGVHRSRSVVADIAGRIWFSTNGGITEVDPSISKIPALPIVHVENVLVDGVALSPGTEPWTVPGQKRVSFLFSGLILGNSESVKYKYRLDNFDPRWNGPTAETRAVYTNLPPGSYTFRVMASNEEGVWSGAPANMAFTIQPAFYQTIWFRLLCVAVFLAFLWGLYQFRVQRLWAEERKLREAIETIPAMVWIAGPDWAVQFRNRRVVDYTGLPQLGKGEKGGAISVHPEDRERIVRRLGASSESGEPFEEEMRIRRTDGEYRWFFCRAVSVRDKRGKIVKWYGAATDIEDRKRAEELQAELAHTNRVSTMGELVASISHELAQPIMATTNNAKASLRWLQRDPPDLTQVRKGTESIIEAGTFASEIINRLRSLYKKAPPERELVAINEVIDEMVPLLRSEANEHAVSIRTDLAADLPKITADRVQLQQVLMNLMLNGIEAMKEAGGMLTVKTERSECGQVLISVTDTGVGLPAGRADEIFNPFFTTKPQGSGMGLAISRSIVESHGGRLWVTSDDGQGATFHFTLPTPVVEVPATI